MISPQQCHFDFPHVSAEPFICIYIYKNRFNSVGCCWELKPLENPIFRQKQHENKKTETLWDLFWCSQGLRVPVLPETVPTPFWDALWRPCLCRASKKVSPSLILPSAEGVANFLSCSWEALAARNGFVLQTLLLAQPGEG